MKWENLRKLNDKVNHKFKDYGNFRAQVTAVGQSRTFKVLKRQSGVFRTNCMDCLDRTNVV